MKQFKKWMFAAIILCGTTMMLGSCSDKDDKSNDPDYEEEKTIVDIPPLEIDPSEYKSIDLNVAVLGSLNSPADEFAAEYWFKNVTSSVNDNTQVVITSQITDANKADIAKVLKNYGTLLLLDPTEENVKKYAEEMGFDPNGNYKNVEVIGLSGFGDQFLSCRPDDFVEPTPEVAPTSIALEKIYKAAPLEYMRMEAFINWAEGVNKKFTEYKIYLAEHNSGVVTARGTTRGDAKSGKIDLFNWPASVDICIHIQDNKHYKGYVYDNFKDNEDDCPYDVTCIYNIIPVYDYSSGSDYYIVHTSMNWNCKNTCKGFVQFDNGTWHRDRRSYLFFPCEGTFYTTPITTNSAYQVMVTADGGIQPESVPFDKDVRTQRSFNLEGNVSAGASGKAGLDGVGVEGNVDANLGFGASWEKEEYFNVKSVEVHHHVSGAEVGHRLRVPDGEDGYRPRMVNSVLDKGIECPNGRAFNTTLSTPESWIWKVSGTKVNTGDAAIKIKLTADTKVSWSSYMITGAEWRVKEYPHTMVSQEFHVTPPSRVDVGFLKINATTKENGSGIHIFGCKVIDKNGNQVTYDKDNLTINYGETFNLGLGANKTYDIELKMGPTLSSAKTYILKDRKVGGHSDPVQKLDTDKFFVLK